MSFVDDTRKLLQDLIAPELKGLQTQVSSLEKTMDARFASLEKTMDARFEAVNDKFAAMNDKMDAKFAAMNDKMDAQKESLLAETRVLSVTLNSSLAMMTRTLQDIDGRLRHMENDRERLGVGGSSAGSAPPAAA